MNRAAPIRAPGTPGAPADDLRAVALPWIVGHLLTVAAFVVAKLAVDQLAGGTDPEVLRDGFLAWDGDWYRGIAEDGYVGVGEDGLRFWPLFPLLGRALGVVFAGNVEPALLIVANVAGLGFLVLLRRLVRFELGDVAVADRAVWLAALWPIAFVLVLGYSEALFLVLAVATFLALRRGRFWWAAGFGFLAGLTRPFAILLVLAAAVEAWRRWSVASPRSRLARIVAVVAPAAGIGVYLGWVWREYGDPFLPLTLQSDPTRRGSLRDPFTSLIDSSGDLFSGDAILPGLHFVWALVLVALVFVAWRRLPASYALFATAAVVLAIATTNLDSFERYTYSAFPLVIATASVTANRDVERSVLGLFAGGLVAYAFLSFIGTYVP